MPRDDAKSALAPVVRDLVFVSAAWDLFRLVVLIPISANPIPAFFFILVKGILVEGIPFFLLRRGKVLAAAWTLTIHALAISAAYVLLTGGIFSSAIALQVAILSSATFVFGKRSAVRLAAGVALFLTILAVAETLGWQPARVFLDPVWVAYTNLISAATISLIPGIRAMNRLVIGRRELEETQKSLSESESLFRGLSEASPAGVFRTTAAGECIYANPRALEIWDQDWDHFKGRGFLDRVHPDDLEHVHAEFSAAHKESRATACEYRLNQPNGVRWVSARCGPVRNARGEYDGGVTTVLDTTESVQINELLREKGAHLRTILNSEPESVQTIGPDGALLEMNPAGLAMIEADTEAQVVGTRVSTLVDPEHRASFEELHRRVLAGESSALEHGITGLKGTARWLETRTAPLRNGAGEIIAAVAVSRDISDRKAREESQRHLELVQTAAPIGLWDQDPRDVMTRANAEDLRMFGFPENSTPLANEFWQRIHPDDQEDFQTAMDAVLAGIMNFEAEYRVIWPDGSIHWVSGKAEVLRDPKGHPIRIIGVNQDITVRKQREESLRESEENFRALFDHAPYGVVLLNPQDFSVTGFNTLAHTQLGYTREEFSKLKVWDWEAFMPDAQVRALGARAQDAPPVEFETKHRMKSGEIREVHITTAPLRIGGRAFIHSAVQDITQRKRAERELLASEARQRILATLSRDFWESKHNPMSALLKTIHLLEADYGDICSVRLLSADGLTLEPPAAAFGQSAWVPAVRDAMAVSLPITDRFIQQEVVRSGKARLIAKLDPTATGDILPPEHQKITLELSSHSLLAVPLRAENHTMGVLMIVRHRRGLPSFNEQDLAFLQELADRAAIAFAAAKATLALRLELEQRKAMEQERESMLAELQQLTHHLENAREDERKRIAREIHDELGQQLTGLKMRFDFLFRAQLTAQQLEEQKTSCHRELESAIRTLRNIATGLRPGVLDSLGPAAALEWLARDFQDKFGVPCDATVQAFPAGDSVATTLFRVAQEALTNAAKHASASKVSLNCYSHSGSIWLEVVDDGVGIEDADLRKNAHFGLIGMRERAALAGGQLTVTRSESGGTHLRLQLPAENVKETENALSNRG